MATPAVIFLLTMSLYPMVTLLRMSVSDVNIGDFLHAWPFVGIANFRQVFADPTFHQVALQTLIYVTSIVFVTLTVGLIVALIIRPETRYSRITQLSMVLVWTLPPVLIGSLWKFLLASDGSINAVAMHLSLLGTPVPFLSEPKTALASIAVVSLWVGMPFAALVIKSAILAVPDDILDAARLDGATYFQLVRRIIVPLIRPTLLVLAVLSIVGAFKSFDYIYVMTSGGPGTSSSTIPFLGYLDAFQSFQFGIGAAVSVVAMLVVLLVAVLYILAVRREERA